MQTYKLTKMNVFDSLSPKKCSENKYVSKGGPKSVAVIFFKTHLVVNAVSTTCWTGKGRALDVTLCIRKKKRMTLLWTFRLFVLDDDLFLTRSEQRPPKMQDPINDDDTKRYLFQKSELSIKINRWWQQARKTMRNKKRLHCHLQALFVRQKDTYKKTKRYLQNQNLLQCKRATAKS